MRHDGSIASKKDNTMEGDDNIDDKNKGCTPKILEKTVGRLGRASLIILGSHAFLVHIRRTMYANQLGKVIQVYKTARGHLKFWLKLLDVAHTGTELDSLVLNMPLRIFLTNTAKVGMG